MFVCSLIYLYLVHYTSAGDTGGAGSASRTISHHLRDLQKLPKALEEVLEAVTEVLEEEEEQPWLWKLAAEN